MMSIRGRRLYQRQDKSRINKELSDYIGKMDDRFEDYSEVVKERRILLRHKTDKDQVLTLPFRTRFNDLGRKTKNLKEFEAGWDKSLTMAKRAVFLTLTTDPGDNDTMWRRNRHMGKAFNRYQSYLGKRHQIQYRYFLETDLRKEFCKIHNISRIETREQHLKYERFIRPHKKEIKAQMEGISFRRKYICVNEFQENGLIHSHIVIFGIRWLAEKETISQDWQRCEQGRIVHIYAMTNDGKRWLWSREKPTDSEGKAPEEYLKKYLKKGLFSEEGFSLYWTVNKRFFSMSRIFQSAPRRTVQVSIWTFIGSWEEYNIPDWVYKQNRGSPAYSTWDGWERIRSTGPGELALC
jgi:hypothetical protein